MTDLPRKALGRSLRLAGLPAAHAGRMAAGLGKRIVGRQADAVRAEARARTAAQLYATLGELKGGAMKLGQALSAMEAMLPLELAGPYREALTRLQEAAPPLPVGAVHDVLAEGMGADWRDRFRSFDDRPAAAASIGQVHRATWHDGTEVAVKVQYPGAAEALGADLRQLERIAPLARVGAPGTNMRQLFGQLRVRLVEELDYEHEADAQCAFARGFAGHDCIVVPPVVEVHPHVLVTGWLEGRPLSEVMATGSDGERDAAGTRLLELFLSGPARAGRIHGDPHPGNFRRLPGGRLGVLDFGSTEAIPAWPDALGPLLRAARDHDTASLADLVTSTGLARPGDIDAATLADVVGPLLEPLRHDRFRFDRAWLQREVRAWSDPRGAPARIQRRAHVPARHLLVQRVAFGLLGVLTSLGATVPVRPEAQRWIPGLA